MFWKKLIQFGKDFFEKKDGSTSTDMPLGTTIYNIEITHGRGGQLARAGGVVLKLIAKEGHLPTLRLPSREGPFGI
jgi:ribosomal protein L2